MVLSIDGKVEAPKLPVKDVDFHCKEQKAWRKSVTAAPNVSQVGRGYGRVVDHCRDGTDDSPKVQRGELRIQSQRPAQSRSTTSKTKHCTGGF